MLIKCVLHTTQIKVRSENTPLSRAFLCLEHRLRSGHMTGVDLQAEERRVECDEDTDV